MIVGPAASAGWRTPREYPGRDACWMVLLQQQYQTIREYERALSLFTRAFFSCDFLCILYNALHLSSYRLISLVLLMYSCVFLCSLHRRRRLGAMVVRTRVYYCMHATRVSLLARHHQWHVCYRSSEIGILSKSPPRLIINPSKPVPRVSGAVVAVKVVVAAVAVAVATGIAV